jgi:hypothetical protein
MREERWLTSTDPTPMLTFLFRRRVSGRKLRLLCCACCRRLWDSLIDERSRQAVEAAERYASGDLGTAELVEVRTAAQEAYFEARAEVHRWMAEAALWTVAVQVPVRKVVDNTLPFYLYPNYHERTGQRLEKETQQANLLRDIFGNPFRPATLDPDWRTSTVVALAEGIYAERAFDRMPILADALQDAGCNNDDILAHCRDASQVHARGCWVVDLVLGKA